MRSTRFDRNELKLVYIVDKDFLKGETYVIFIIINTYAITSGYTASYADKCMSHVERWAMMAAELWWTSSRDERQVIMNA